MKLNHLNVTVTDVSEVKNFLETYFGLTCNVNIGNAFAGMVDDDGFLLNLMHGKDVNYPETFHIGFPQNSKEEIDALNRRLKDDGYDVETPAIVHGSYAFYLKAPGGITLEAYFQVEGEDPKAGARPSFGKK